ncbi:hypothetical protein BGX26_012139 [Mortierella sp. AD094]|nr:hypothetical protein BGX26_012139 [Mortierella sp. AD094]
MALLTIAKLTRGGLSIAQSYLYQIIASSTERMLTPTHVMRTKSASVDASEMNLYTNIWQPLLAKLFAGSPPNVRIKIGETTMPWGTEEKREYYTDDSIVAFKIDARILLDHKGGEYDLVAMEVAKNTEKSKICSDGAKLFREAKVITNVLSNILPDEDGWGLVEHEDVPKYHRRF